MTRRDLRKLESIKKVLEPGARELAGVFAYPRWDGEMATDEVQRGTGDQSDNDQQGRSGDDSRNRARGVLASRGRNGALISEPEA